MAASGVRRPRVAVVGGGPAGLAVAHDLSAAGVEVVVLEADDGLGGLARSFDLDGLTVERYYHFVCWPDRDLVELAAELGLGPRWRPTLTSVYHEGRLYPFTSALDLLRFSPLPHAARVAMGVEALRWSLREGWAELDRRPAREWLISRLGERTYRMVWEPLLASKFGPRHGEVSAAWIWHRIQRVARSRRGPLMSQVMGTFPGGTEALLGRLVERLEARGSRVRSSAPVERVLAAGGRASGVRLAGGEELEADAVVMAVPLPRAAPLLPDGLERYRAALEAVEFLGVVCAVLWLDEGVTGSFWCNVHDSRLDLIGLIEMSALAPETGRGGALVYVPFYLPVEAPLYRATDAEVLEKVIGELETVRPRRRRLGVRAGRVFRSPFAQAICTVGFGDRVPPHRAPLPGLFLIDSTQMYPVDRTISGTVALAHATARLVLGDLGRR